MITHLTLVCFSSVLTFWNKQATQFIQMSMCTYTSVFMSVCMCHLTRVTPAVSVEYKRYNGTNQKSQAHRNNDNHCGICKQQRHIHTVVLVTIKFTGQQVRQTKWKKTVLNTHSEQFHFQSIFSIKMLILILMSLFNTIRPHIISSQADFLAWK